MRTGEENIVVPLDSPERPPATNYAAVRSSSPACLSVMWAPFVSCCCRGGSQPGLRHVWTAPALARVVWAAVSFGPAQL